MHRPYRERTAREDLFTPRRPGGVLVPRPVAWVLEQQARKQRALHAARTVARVTVALATLALLFVHVQAGMTLQAPPVPSSEKICGSSVLNGPSSPPGGAVTVAAGDNSGVTFDLPATTYWFAPGTHTLGSGMFNAVATGQGSTYIGAPGAVIDGQGLNHTAFVGVTALTSNVTIEYLTIQNFDPPGSQGAVNGNGSPGWTEQFNTMQDILPGAATMAGTNAVIDSNCLTHNGEYGFNAYTANDTSFTGGPTNVTVDGNEISYNNTCNWENVSPFPITPPAGCTGAGQYTGCGCSGGGKFWANNTGQYEGNYVHDNYSTGAWWDNDNTGWDIQDNYFAGNWGSAITYEISYNARITGNTFVDNAWGAGPFNPGFPSTAVYISESGSDSRVAGPYGGTFQVTGNGFYDNWGGVVLWENSDRFCGQLSPTGDDGCTLDNPMWSFANRAVCGSPYPVPPARGISAPAPPGRRTIGRGGTAQGQAFAYLIYKQPYYSDCRWKTQNVVTSGNLFDFTPANIPSCTTGNGCGFNGLFSEIGVTPPYLGNVIENAVTFSQGNVFSGNTYCGPWQFMPMEQGFVDTFTTWQGAPYAQDAGSTLNSAACLGPPPVPAVKWPGPVNRTVTVPIRAGR